MEKKRKVTESTFRHAKLLLKAGETQKGVAEYLGISKWTAGLIDRSDSFDEYKNNIAALYSKSKEKTVKKEPEKEPEIKVEDLKLPGGTMSGNYQLNRIFEQLKNLNETMTLISKKLTFIVEDLYGTEEKKNEVG